jgi:N-acetylmuramate 1-kinase
MTLQDQMTAFAKGALGLSGSVAVTLSPLGGRGSDRRFFRLTWNGERSAILIHYDRVRAENAYYADIAAFLGHIGVPVPRFVGHSPDDCLMVMEDLGDQDLWSLRSTAWERRERLYQKTLAVAQRLHGFPAKDFPAEQVRLMEAFGPHLYRWERDYFRDHFVKAVCGIDLAPAPGRALEGELAVLAERLHGTRQTLVHRDLQSQNVMIRNGEPFLIDFQGMRLGNPFYDLASLLNDSYVNLSGDELKALLRFSHGLSQQGPDWPAFQKAFWEASVQRLMQALGAYGFLGLTKGMKGFLDHIPAGLQNLLRALNETQSLPHLRQLAAQCREALEQHHPMPLE